MSPQHLHDIFVFATCFVSLCSAICSFSVWCAMVRGRSELEAAAAEMQRLRGLAQQHVSQR